MVGVAFGGGAERLGDGVGFTGAIEIGSHVGEREVPGGVEVGPRFVVAEGGVRVVGEVFGAGSGAEGAARVLKEGGGAGVEFRPAALGIGEAAGVAIGKGDGAAGGSGEQGIAAEQAIDRGP